MKIERYFRVNKYPILVLLILGTAGVSIALFSYLSTERAQAADFNLTVYRQYPGNKCTSGYLAVDDVIKAYTLERPWKDNTQNISSIPAGTYDASLRYDHDDHWRIELQGVPGRDHVQIHVGNFVSDTIGCILVGKKLGSDLCSVQQSKEAYAELKKSFYGTDNPTSTPNKSIKVKLVDAGPQ
jgi:hypothetical protein